MLFRWSDASPANDAVAQHKVFELIGGGVTASSPPEAQPLRMFLPHDSFTMNRDRVLAAAKARALSMIAEYAIPRERRVATVDAAPLIQRLESLYETQKISPHDVTVGRVLARLLCGPSEGKVTELSEDELFERERAAFLQLVQTPETIARIRHMLATGRPLQN